MNGFPFAKSQLTQCQGGEETVIFSQEVETGLTLNVYSIQLYVSGALYNSLPEVKVVADSEILDVDLSGLFYMKTPVSNLFITVRKKLEIKATFETDVTVIVYVEGYKRGRV